MSDSKEWYYSLNGSRQGPFSLDEMKKFVADKLISATTKVWPGVGDWVTLKETELHQHLEVSNEPPPLASDDVDNRFVWAVAAVPLVGSFIEYAASANLWWLFIAMNIGLCVFDEKRLKAAGHKAPESFWAAIVPVYLWKRATLIGHQKHYFFAWVGAFVLSLGVSAMGGEAAIEDAACPIVTEIIQKQLYGSAKCMAVTIDEEVKSGFYKAHTVLDNGNTLEITIEERGDDIYVLIPSQ